MRGIANPLCRGRLCEVGASIAASRLRKQGFRGGLRTVGRTMMFLSDAWRVVSRPVGGPGLGACDVRSSLAAPAYVASVACGAGVSAVISPAIRTRL